MPRISYRWQSVANHEIGGGPCAMVQLVTAAVACLLFGLTGCGAPADGQISHVTGSPIAESGSTVPLSTRSPAGGTQKTGPEETATQNSHEQPTQGDRAQTEPGNPASELSERPATRPSVRSARGGGVNEITFDDLKLEMPLGTLFDRSMLTPRAAELDGRQVRLRGFIYAGGVFQQTGIKNFPFVMNTQCKFGPQGLAYCVILVDLDEGVTTEFTTYPIEVEGKLTVRPYNAGGFTWSVYHLQGNKVR